MCAVYNSTQNVNCHSISSSADTLASMLLVSESLIQYALDMEHALFPAFLAGAGVMFLLSITLLSVIRLRHRSKKVLTPTTSTKWLLVLSYVLLGTSNVLAPAWHTLQHLFFRLSTFLQCQGLRQRSSLLEELRSSLYNGQSISSRSFLVLDPWRIMRSQDLANTKPGGLLPSFVPPRPIGDPGPPPYTRPPPPPP
jgi:hypothetical protein